MPEYNEDVSQERELQGSLVDEPRRRFLGMTAGASLATLGSAGVAGAATTEPALTIIHDTHFHGRFGDADGANISRYHTKVNELRDRHPNSLFVANGDDLGPSMFSSAFQGEHMVEALDLFDPVMDTLGNHEFDHGVDVAEKRIAESNFPWSSANVLTPDGNPIPGTKRWQTTDVDGLTVGLFGLAPGNTKNLTNLPDDYTVLDPVDAAKEATDALRKSGADVVVMSSHLTLGNAEDVAAAVDGIDLIVGDHAGNVLDEPKTVNGTIVSAVGDQFEHIGRVSLAADGSLVEWERIDLTAEVTPSAPMQDIVEKWRSRLDDKLGQTIATTGVELDARFSTNYHTESRIGNLITDAMCARTDADAAITNAGGIRSNSTYGPGEITAANVLNVLPFGNSIVVLELTGEDLLKTLSSQILTMESEAGRKYGPEVKMQVSGLQFEWVPHESASKTIRNVTVDGEALVPDETYEIAVNSFMAGGGDGYPLTDEPRLFETDDILGMAVVEYLKDQRYVEPEVENRMIRVDTDAGTTDEIVDRDDEEAVTAVFDAPTDAVSLFEATFEGVTQYGQSLSAKQAELVDGRLEVTFDARSLGVLATGPTDIDLRVVGGYESDRYDRTYFHHSTLVGTVDVEQGGSGPRSWWRS